MSKRRRFGSLRKLPSGRYQVRYQGPDGLYRTAPDTFPAKANADRYLAAVETDMRRGNWLDPQRSDVRLSTYASGWLAQRTVKGRPLAARTRDTYEHSLRAWILPELGTVALTDLTPALVRTWHTKVSAKTGQTATRQAYALLRAICNTAVDDGALPRNPCRIKGAGQPNSKERPLLDVESVELLASQMPVHLRTLVTVAFWGALRHGELLALRRSDIDFATGIVSIDRQVIEVDGHGPREVEPKVGSRRQVHLPQQALDALRDHLARAHPGMPSARVFARPDGSELRAHHVHHAWIAARRRAGLAGIHLHDLRHAGLTLAAQQGATLAEVQRRAGHVSARAALLYQHAAEHRDAELAAKLSRLASVAPIRRASGT